jgi:hypothetical protein
MKRALLTWSQSLRFLLSAIAATLILSATAMASVTSEPVTTHALSDAPIHIPLNLTSEQLVAGINGRFDFDPALFTNPTIEFSSGQYGFTVMGNEATPGQFLFLLYRDPTRELNLTLPVFYLRLEVVTPQGSSVFSTLTYPIAAASDPDGNSLDNVSFSDVTVNLNGSVAHDWLIYE